MSSIRISLERPTSDVLISSDFITDYMPSANGEYVKLYLYLLKALQTGSAFSLSDIADIFEITEKDVIRALKYWDNQKILSLTYDGKDISNITLRTPWDEEKPPEKEPEPPLQAMTLPQENVSEFSVTSAMMREAEESDAFKDLLNLTKIYFKKPLNNMDYEKLIWIFFQMGKNFDACEVLVEYCAEHKKKVRPMRQLEALACQCIEEELFLAKDIRSHLLHQHHCELVKEALGVSRKALATTELTFIRRWFEEWGFDEALVKEACARATRNTEDNRFEYANKILENWHEEKIHTMQQVSEKDQKFKEQKKSRPAKSGGSTSSYSNRFNNFEQREIDFDEMEALVFSHAE